MADADTLYSILAEESITEGITRLATLEGVCFEETDVQPLFVTVLQKILDEKPLLKNRFWIVREVSAQVEQDGKSKTIKPDVSVFSNRDPHKRVAVVEMKYDFGRSQRVHQSEVRKDLAKLSAKFRSDRVARVFIIISEDPRNQHPCASEFDNFEANPLCLVQYIHISEGAEHLRTLRTLLEVK